MPTAKRDWNAANRPVIEQFRKDGRVSKGKNPLLLLTTTGVRSGKARVTPLNYSRDDDRYIVMASKGGSASNPDWYHNLVAHPDVIVEAAGERFEAIASVSEGAERQRLFELHSGAMPFFGGYERAVKKRQIPVIVLSRRA